MLASTLVLSAAIGSLFGPEPVQKLVGSPWFLAGTGIATLAGLLAAASAVARRSWPSVIQHIGLVIALVGVGVNQRSARGGYLFLEQGAGASNFVLSRNLPPS